MKVCILGSGITSLTLAKSLVNQGLYVDIFYIKKLNNESNTRTIGISKSNIDFFNENITNINKFLWDIKKIEILSENLKDEKILNFEKKNKTLFSLIKNKDLSKYLFDKLNKNKYAKFKRNYQNFEEIKKKYRLIFNCESNSTLTRKFFYKKIEKNYHSYAHTALIRHKKLTDNITATQIFTNKGPLAFLPISSTETSVVYSARGEKKIEFLDIIKKYNSKYTKIKIEDNSSFNLKSSNLRCYYHENILAFGDLLHKLHPLAGQGFNMTLRDIKEILKLIEFRKNLGLELDTSIFSDFEKKTKHKNYIFSNGIDFIYEIFNLESKIKNNFLSKSIKLIGNNKYANNFFVKIADSGFRI